MERHFQHRRRSGDTALTPGQRRRAAWRTRLQEQDDDTPRLPDILALAAAVARIVAIDDPLTYRVELAREATALGVSRKALEAEVSTQRRQIEQRKIDEIVADVLKRMNDQYSVVLEGSKVLVYKTVYDPMFKRDGIIALTFDELRVSVAAGPHGMGSRAMI
jgi:hypothetical protein